MGTLSGIRVIEMAGLGPVPFAAMMLADMGADVVRVDAPRRNADDPHDQLGPIWRGRSGITLDLKEPGDLARAEALIAGADVVLEGYRPGVMERLGLGPETLLEANPRLVVGRMTGWGQHGALSSEAGHDINYLALSGILRQIGRQGERPLPPLNLVGDYGGGGMLMVAGVLAALVERSTSGRGQVIDAAMIDGAALLMVSVTGWMAKGEWGAPGTNIIDTGAPFYEVYTTSDGQHLAVGAVEPRFYRRLLEVFGLDARELPDQYERSAWPRTKALFAGIVAQRTLAEWVTAFDGADACVSPVLSIREAAEHPHFRERRTWAPFPAAAGVDAVQPAAAPRFGRTPSATGAVGAPTDFATVARRWDLARADGPSIR